MNPCIKEAELAVMKTEITQLQQGFNELKEVYNLIYGLTTNVSLLTDQMVRMTNDVEIIKSDGVSIALLTDQMLRMGNDVKSIKQDVEETKEKPIKEYTTLKLGAISTAIGIIIKVISDKIY